MEKDLQTLIKSLEEEKTNLLRLIDSAVKDQEYLSAHFHSEALQQINRKLRTLNNLDDELYDQKNAKRHAIERIKTARDSGQYSVSGDFFEKGLEKLQKELQQLNEIPKNDTPKTNGNVVDTHLDLLLKRKLRSFQIVLKKRDNLLIEIKRIKGTIRVTIPYANRLFKNEILSEERITKLKGLGFEFTDKRDKIIKTLAGGAKELSPKIKTLLAIIVFEVFYFKGLDREACIEILGKSHR